MLIKICGVKTPELAQMAIESGANYIGLMLYAASKRYINIQQAAIIAKAVKKTGGIPVAVFVDANAEQMLSVCQQTGVEVVQLHGSISRREHHKLPKTMQRIYVRQVQENGLIMDDIDHGFEFVDKNRDLLLFDGVQGGSGKNFDWNNFVMPYAMPFLLAGGLNCDNIALAIKKIKPTGVDVSSGVENNTGDKDIALIKKFIVLARGN